MEKLKILLQIYSGMARVYSLTAIAWLKVRMKYGPFTIRSGSTDLPVFQQIFLYHDYALNLDFEPEFIIDAGAYVGYSAMYFHMTYPKAKIVSIEPSSSNFETLKKNTQVIPAIRLYNSGLWSKPAFLRIEDRKMGHWGFQTVEVEENEKWDVTTIDVATIFKNAQTDRIDIFKIDIEGSEFELFSDNPAWVSKVRIFIIIEFHEQIRPGCTQLFRNAISPFKWTEFQQGENLIFIRQNF